MEPKVVIQLVEELKDFLPVGEICRYLGVGRSSYYRWRKIAVQFTQKEIRNQQIGNLCKQHKFRYGYRKIAALYQGVCTSYSYQKAVKVKGITMSMSRKGTPADNSAIETFHSTLKSETCELKCNLNIEPV